MSSKNDETPLKIIFLPWPQAGHMYPMLDLAKVISSHGVACTIITTPANASYFHISENPNMSIHTLSFPGPAVGLPVGVENFSSVTPEDMSKVAQGIFMLRKPTEDFIREISPDCIISDMYFPWSSDFANELGIPRVFQITSTFFKCCADIVKLHAPHEQVKNDEDWVTFPFLPHKIVMKKSQIPEWVRIPNHYTHFMDVIAESSLKSYGVLSNTFPCDVEKEYQEFCNKLTGLKVWNVGPLCLQVTRNEQIKDKDSSAEAEAEADDCWMTCSKWLDQKKPNSVLYVSFGSLVRFPDVQLQEIAAGLESSGHDFIWVVRKKEKTEDGGGKDGDWSVEEFRKTMTESNKGFIIEDWAPQVLILKHRAIGGMVTHCGWNTILEGVTTAGVPLVTWPLFAEQFYNERFIVDVLKIGVAVGASVWGDVAEAGTKEIIKSEQVKAAVQAVMGDGEGAAAMRQRAKELCEAAGKAVESGGSSQANLVAFLDELKAKRVSKLV